ncbi:hypothetical protein, partial [Anaerosporomusa subterranea]|uniref:hypothetical protein n=1 Tax=Anaerosporomusa subterranea TaxID=1794912 RepID=UPI001E420BDB
MFKKLALKCGSYNAHFDKDNTEHGDEHWNDNRTPKEVLVRIRMRQPRGIDHVDNGAIMRQGV